MASCLPVPRLGMGERRGGQRSKPQIPGPQAPAGGVHSLPNLPPPLGSAPGPPNGGNKEAAGPGSTAALDTELLGLGLRLSGISGPLAAGTQHHFEGLLGFWAFLGSHRVRRPCKAGESLADVQQEGLQSLGRER